MIILTSTGTTGGAAGALFADAVAEAECLGADIFCIADQFAAALSAVGTGFPGVDTCAVILV